METEESSITDSRGSEILTTVSTLASTDPVSSSFAITGAVLSSSTEFQSSIQDESRLASTRQEFTASQPTVYASALTQGIIIDANEQWDQRMSDVGGSSKMKARGCTAKEGIQEMLLVSEDPMQMTDVGAMVQWADAADRLGDFCGYIPVNKEAETEQSLQPGSSSQSRPSPMKDVDKCMVMPSPTVPLIHHH